MSKINEKSATKVRDLVWEQVRTSAVDTWHADTALGRFTLARRFIGDSMFLCTPPLDGVAKEINCKDFDDGVAKAQSFVSNLVNQLVG